MGVAEGINNLIMESRESNFSLESSQDSSSIVSFRYPFITTYKAKAKKKKRVNFCWGVVIPTFNPQLSGSGGRGRRL